ncbi:Uncharacterised protein [uncultured archaeon]|nr:Uncharacterised protein [uncultured archaeon]
MKYNRLLLCIAVIAYFLMQADALPSTITKDEFPGSFGPFSVTSQKEIDADNSIDEVNVTGVWSLDLLGKPREKMKLHLIQNEDLIRGQGVITGRNESKKATANGSLSGWKLSLTVVPVGVSNIYKLNLSLTSLTAGNYVVHQADGLSRSGKVTFAVSTNIFKHASAVDEWDI